MRVTFWGAMAMGITAGVGVLFETVVFYSSPLPEDRLS